MKRNRERGQEDVRRWKKSQLRESEENDKKKLGCCTTHANRTQTITKTIFIKGTSYNVQLLDKPLLQLYYSVGAPARIHNLQFTSSTEIKLHKKTNKKIEDEKEKNNTICIDDGDDGREDSVTTGITKYARTTHKIQHQPEFSYYG